MAALSSNKYPAHLQKFIDNAQSRRCLNNAGRVYEDNNGGEWSMENVLLDALESIAISLSEISLIAKAPYQIPSR